MNTRRKMRLKALKVITFPRFSINMIFLKNVYYTMLRGENTYTALANQYMRKMNYFGLPEKKNFMENRFNGLKNINNFMTGLMNLNYKGVE